jgi:hypothetical protein
MYNILNQLKVNGRHRKILNNRHWFDCFELIKGYLISNWIDYNMKLNLLMRWTSKHSNYYRWVKIDICRIKIALAWDWFLLWC